MSESFSVLLGKTLTAVTQVNGRDGDEIHFTTDTGDTYKLYHAQSCCEDVHIEDVVGDYSDLIGTPILRAEESSNTSNGDYMDQEWTYYKLATIKGSVDIRWYGTSNGYYSTSVYFAKI